MRGDGVDDEEVNRRIRANGDPDDGVRPTGRFRIYLGSAAGVGKTCAMLDEGWRRHERGTDVVVGFVETHGRPHTAALVRDLEVVPRRTVEYRGTSFDEMDLARVLARRPEVVLVDELAHTNVPGSGQHAKRWEDVLDLLEAGIAVVSTVNIQHVESLADAVEVITGTTVRERVPDWVVRRADQIELIDSSADQLRRRMLHGNIYANERISIALAGFFKTENLVALRELALRFVADETEEELLRYLRREHPAGVWDTSERILVAVTGAPGSEGVIRRAARMAARSKGELLVVHVTDGDRPEDRGRLVVLRQVSDSVGAEWFEVPGDDPARSVVEFAYGHQITQIVVGATRRSRWEELSRGNVVSKLLRFAADRQIDVHIIARRDNKGSSDESEPDADDVAGWRAEP
jgi:two-component system, OmpR family, sensor histidine kinase KdpD